MGDTMTTEQGVEMLEKALRDWQALPAAKRQLVQYNLARAASDVSKMAETARIGGMTELADSFGDSMRALYSAGVLLTAFAFPQVSLEPDDKPLGDRLLSAWEKQHKQIRDAIDALAKAVNDPSLNGLDEAVERACEIIRCRIIEERVMRETLEARDTELAASKAVIAQMQLRQTQAASVLESWAKNGIGDAAALFAIGQALSGEVKETV